MKLASLYTSLTKNEDDIATPDIKPPPEEDAGRFQARQSWLNSTITKEHLSDINQTINQLFDDSIRLATTQPDKYQTVIQNLTRIDTLRKIVENYGKFSN